MLALFTKYLYSFQKNVIFMKLFIDPPNEKKGVKQWAGN